MDDKPYGNLTKDEAEKLLLAMEEGSRWRGRARVEEVEGKDVISVLMSTEMWTAYDKLPPIESIPYPTRPSPSTSSGTFNIGNDFEKFREVVYAVRMAQQDSEDEKAAPSVQHDIGMKTPASQAPTSVTHTDKATSDTQELLQTLRRNLADPAKATYLAKVPQAEKFDLMQFQSMHTLGWLKGP